MHMIVPLCLLVSAAHLAVDFLLSVTSVQEVVSSVPRRHLPLDVSILFP